jgi:hypothetical protein
MEEALAYFFAILFLIGIVIGLIISIGWIIIIAISGFGLIKGLLTAGDNFFKALGEAHQQIKTLPRVEIMDTMEKVGNYQPANLMYPFGGGWQVISYVRNNVFSSTEIEAKNWWSQGSTYKLKAEFSGGVTKYWTYCIYVGFSIAGLIQYLAAHFFIFTFVAFQFTFLSLWMVTVFLLIGVLTVINYIYGNLFKIFYRCPDCHANMIIPIFICPHCSTKHTRLWPNVYGVFHRTCTNCGHQLGVLDINGRNNITRICTDCSRPMNKDIGRMINVHIPVIGGPSTGKSSFIFSATREFIEGYAPPQKIHVTFPDTQHESVYQKNLSMLAEGKTLVKTPDIVPQAYNISINKPGNWFGRIVYIYDAAGEAYSNETNTYQQTPYFRYVHGIIFIIDPFSIELFVREHQAEIDVVRQAVRPSDIGPMEAYSRMMSVLETVFGLKKETLHELPVAVVVSKSDALNLESMIGHTAAVELMNNNPSIQFEEDAINDLVIQFLQKYQLGNFLRDLSGQFNNVRYFSCSSLGRLPDEDTRLAFQPVRVIDPFLWLLGETGVLNLSKERAKLVDQQDRQIAAARGNIFLSAKYYFWDSLNHKNS